MDNVKNNEYQCRFIPKERRSFRRKDKTRSFTTKDAESLDRGRQSAKRSCNKRSTDRRILSIK